ncbi:MAG: FAD-dependent oxidoreductase [Candidatus Aenigmarchaeota archaeon]|nr:FAD-dependent oxidoreductase [Candidatus Aenigmarchaeota archaeon]
MYDLVIVGGGVVGLGAAMYAGRLNLKTAMIGDNIGGTITLTDIVENYPGFERLTGLELAEKLRKHAENYDVALVESKVTDIEKKGSSFVIKTEEKSYEAKSILIATGSKHRELGVPGEKEFEGKGVHTCALCDGYYYRDKIIAVVGGSDSAGKEALLLTQWGKKVYIIYRGETIRPEPVNMKRIEANKKIEIINNTNVKEIKGDKMVKSVVLDKPYNGKNELALDAVFVEIGATPMSYLAEKLGVKLSEKKEIIIDRESKTNVPGIFAAGDVVDTKFKQAITGVGEAVSAVYSAYKYVNENGL